MSPQRTPRPGTYTRSRRLPVPDETGGGGGTATVAWGPDFGESSDDNTFTAQAALSLTDVAAVYEPLICQGALSLTDVAASYEPVTCQGSFSQLVYDATIVRSANAAVNDGPDNWTTPNNATGAPDNADATRAGQALASTDGNLRLNYADFTGGIETFTISLVQLRYDVIQSGTVLNNGGLHLEYRLAVGAWTSLAIYTGDVNFDASPDVYDITAAVGGDWTKLNTLEVRVRAVLGVGTALVTCSCDAVEVRVVAQKVVTP